MIPAPSSRSFLALERGTGALRWCRRAAWVIAAAAGSIANGALAAEPAGETATQVRATLARLESHKEALARANAAVVGVEVVAVEDARSIATLGKQRQGSGVLIGDDGLVLTIGYLILEADQVDLVASDGRRVPARVVAYDLATGFGLVQSLAPLGIAPAPLGVSAKVGADEPLLFASGGDDRDLSLARMVSRRAFSGYWEYHIEDALFTAPARTDHSGAGLFNADGELVGVGSLVVGNASDGSGPVMRGNMFVPVDLLKPILAEMRSRGSSRDSRRAWIGLNCVEVGGHVQVVRLAADGPAEAAGVQPKDVIVAIDGVRIADLASMYRTLWRGDRPDRDVVLEIRRDGETIRVPVHAVDRMQTLSRPKGV
ncbi:MAG: S1C family serine protease [Caldimonas sp.]